jgi:calcineurin-like phosphoesterase family protein
MGSIGKAAAVWLPALLLMTACQASSEPTAPTAEHPRVPEGAKVVAAAGDIACEPSDSDFEGGDPNQCQYRATADLLAQADAVIPLGDLQYPDGALESYHQGYDPTWGKFADESYPAPGNHDYHVAGAEGYFDYWTSKGRPTGPGRGGYYSWDLGAWHLIALNSNCEDVACDEGSPQNDFLERDLASSTQRCVLAYWHHPLFNSGEEHGSSVPSGTEAFWRDLSAAGTDIVLNGHEHNYQRYGKQDGAGRARSDGIREFVAGTGGKSHYGLLEEKDANYQSGNATDFGVLLLHLGDDSYSWEFVSVSGDVLDAGGPVRCN